ASCPPIAPSPRVEPLVSAAGRAARAARAALSNRRRAAGRGARGGARAPLAALAPIGAALLGDAARGGHRRAARGGGAVGLELVEPAALERRRGPRCRAPARAVGGGGRASS